MVAREVQERCREADAVLAFMTDRIDGAFFRLPRLKVIGAALKGYDNIDVAAARRAGVWVTIVPDLLTVPTAELAIGLMLALSRHMMAGDRRIRDNGFNGWRPTCTERASTARDGGYRGLRAGWTGDCRAAGRLSLSLHAFDARSNPGRLI